MVDDNYNRDYDVDERLRKAVEKLKRRMSNPTPEERLAHEIYVLDVRDRIRQMAYEQQRNLLRVIEETRFTRFTG